MQYNLNYVQCCSWLFLGRNVEWRFNTEKNYEVWLWEAYWPNKSENEIWRVCVIGYQESSTRGLIITWLHPSGFNKKSWSAYETLSPRIAMAIELHMFLLKGEKIQQISFWGSKKLAKNTNWQLPPKLKWLWVFVAIRRFSNDRAWNINMTESSN